MPVRRAMSLPEGYDNESDHSSAESESLRHFLRPINPDSLKYLADWHRRDNWRQHVTTSLAPKKEPPLPKE